MSGKPLVLRDAAHNNIRKLNTRLGALCGLTTAVGSFLCLPQVAADPLEDLTAGWYSVEAIVFQRTDVSQSDTTEQLYDIVPRSVPPGIRSLEAIAETNGYNLNPLALVTLEFPTLSFDCAAAGGAKPYRPPVVPAWYQPKFPDTGVQSGLPGTEVFPAVESASTRRAETLAAVPPPETLRPRTLSGGRLDGSGATSDYCLRLLADIEGSVSEGSNARRAQTPNFDSATGDPCPPAFLDIPMAPGSTLPLCRLPPGQPPPRIEPVLESHPLLDWLSAARRFETGLQDGSYRAGTGGAMLRREANRIRNAGDLRLLWHGRWTQPVPPRNSPEPLLVQTGRQTDGVPELEGTFDITLGRYLHFHARLWWVNPLDARNSPVGNPVGPVGNPLGVAADIPVENMGSMSDDPNIGPDAPLAPENVLHMVLEESRAMRSGTLHYLDHPVLGVLVRADPVEPPDWLVDASAALTGNSHQRPR